jgi:cytochrome b561
MTQPSPEASRRIFWIGASLVAGVIMLFFANDKGLFRNPDTRVFEMSVFFGAWVAIVLLLRVFSRRFRSFEDLTIEELVKRRDDDPPKR